MDKIKKFYGKNHAGYKIKLLRNSVIYHITLGTNCANLQLTLKIVKIGDYKLHITFLALIILQRLKLLMCR